MYHLLADEVALPRDFVFVLLISVPVFSEKYDFLVI